MSPWKQRLGCSDLFETSFTKDSRTAKANFSLYFCLIPLQICNGPVLKVRHLLFHFCCFSLLNSWHWPFNTLNIKKGPQLIAFYWGHCICNPLCLSLLWLWRNFLSIIDTTCSLQNLSLCKVACCRKSCWTTPWNSLDHFRQSECFWLCPGPRCWVWPQWLTIVFQPLANTVVNSAHLGSQPVLGRAIGLRHKYTRAGSHCLWPVSPCQPFSAPRPTLYLPTI